MSLSPLLLQNSSKTQTFLSMYNALLSPAQKPLWDVCLLNILTSPLKVEATFPFIVAGV